MTTAGPPRGLPIMARRRRATATDQQLQFQYHEVVELLRERGSLSKDDITDLLELDDLTYGRVARKLRTRREVEALPGGGFEMRVGRTRGVAEVEESDDATGPTNDPGLEWQNLAISRLMQLFLLRELKLLVGSKLVYAMTNSKIECGGPSHLNKKDLARALMIQHNFVDLFANQRVRKLVARKCDAPCPKRWVPGKGTAHAFVQSTGFPPPLAGLPTQARPDDFARLEGRVELKELEPYQVEIRDEIIRELDSAAGRAIATLPTGAGKTRIAVEAIRNWLTARHQIGTSKRSTVLWIAHSGELCDQAYLSFEQVWQSSVDVCPLLLFRFWGVFTSDLATHMETLGNLLHQPSVLVSTPQRIINLMDHPGPNEREVLENIQASIGAIVIDEAHRAGAPSYRRIIEHFHQACATTPVIGLTATPFRYTTSGGEREGVLVLKELFKRLIEPQSLGTDPRDRLESMGVLAHPNPSSISINLPFKAPTIGQRDETQEGIAAVDEQLCRRTDRPARRRPVLTHILPYCLDEANSVLYFGPSVHDAETMAILLRDAGVSAVAIHGGTRDSTRRQAISDFKAGRIRVLCNCEVLTTGFDAPRVTHVVMARPTISRVLYEQMVGRGLRGPKFGGTEVCHIIDCEDNYRNGRPRMGYDEFREVWKPVERRQGKWM